MCARKRFREMSRNLRNKRKRNTIQPSWSKKDFSLQSLRSFFSRPRKLTSMLGLEILSEILLKGVRFVEVQLICSHVVQTSIREIAYCFSFTPIVGFYGAIVHGNVFFCFLLVVVQVVNWNFTSFLFVMP